MATISPSSTVDRVRETPPLGLPPWLLITAGAVAILAFSPLWYTYLAWTWADGHYQYFPLLLAGIAGLYYSRLAAARQAATPPSMRIVLVGAIGAIGLLFAGLLVFSGFLGIVATTFAAWVVTYAIFGWGGLKSLSPVLALMMFAIPLPLGLDSELIFQMQFLASQVASLLLDGAGIMHVRQGVILITEQAQYMTEEACSGVRSLFSSLSVVAFYSVLSRIRFSRVVVNLIQTVGWVLVGNAVRVAACVYLADNVSTWYASGAGHEMLSIVIFVFILAMVISTDRLICGFANRVLGLDWGKDADEIRELDRFALSADMSETNQGWFGRRGGTRNRVAAMGDEMAATKRRGWLRSKKRRAYRPYTEGGIAAELMEPESGYEKKPKLAKPAAGSSQTLDDDFDGAGRAMSKAWAIALVGCLFVATLVGGLIGLQRFRSTPIATDQMISLPILQEEDLPADIAGWTKADFQVTHRDGDPYRAEDSFIWTYRKDGLIALISVDCPWADFHDLNMCYTALGWKTEKQYFVPPPQDAPLSDYNYSRLTMQNRDGRFGQVLFTMVDRYGAEYQGYSWRHGRAGWGGLPAAVYDEVAATIGLGDQRPKALPLTTIQLYSDHQGDYALDELKQLETFYFAARQALLESRRWKSEDEVAAQ